MRRAGVAAIIAATCGVACKTDKAKPKPDDKPAPADTRAPWVSECAETLRAAPKATAARRVKTVIDGCRPCGDWAALMSWNKPPDEGGPPHEAIEAAMIACNAFCNSTAKRNFLGTLADARGRTTNKPWRLLGDACKAEVSAVPDDRFMSAPLFALDRIARATAAQPDLAPLAAALELPLPATSVSGGGFELAASPVTKPEAGPVHVTVSMSEMRVGTLPRARLGAAGVAIDLGADPYPGTLVDPKGLAAALDRLAPDRSAPIAVVAPRQMPAARLVDVVAEAPDRALVLAVAADGAPPGWTLLGTLPVALAAKPGANALEWRVAGGSIDPVLRQIKATPAAELRRPQTILIGDGATVTHVTTLIAALAFWEVSSVTLARAPLRP